MDGGTARFPHISDAMMEAVDKADSAGFSRDDVLQPGAGSCCPA